MEGVTTWTMDIIVTGPNHGRHEVIVEKKIWIDWYPLNKRNYNMLQDEPTLLHSKLVYDTTERLKKYFLRKWPLDWTLTIKKFNNFVFCQKIQKKQPLRTSDTLHLMTYFWDLMFFWTSSSNLSWEEFHHTWRTQTNIKTKFIIFLF